MFTFRNRFMNITATRPPEPRAPRRGGVGGRPTLTSLPQKKRLPQVTLATSLARELSTSCKRPLPRGNCGGFCPSVWWRGATSTQIPVSH